MPMYAINCSAEKIQPLLCMTSSVMKGSDMHNNETDTQAKLEYIMETAWDIEQTLKVFVYNIREENDEESWGAEVTEQLDRIKALLESSAKEFRNLSDGIYEKLYPKKTDDSYISEYAERIKLTEHYYVFNGMDTLIDKLAKYPNSTLIYRTKFISSLRDNSAAMGIKYSCCGLTQYFYLLDNWQSLSEDDQNEVSDYFISNAANHHLQCLNNKKDNNE